MSEDVPIGWLPWRGPRRVRWTLAFALCLLAILGTSLQLHAWTRWAAPVLASLALLGLVLAVSASPRQRPARRPWRGPHPVRNTVAFVLPQLALAILVGDFVWRQGDIVGAGWPRTQLVMSVGNTLLFASALASTEHGRGVRWFLRIAWGCFAVLTWWEWHRWVTR